MWPVVHQQVMTGLIIAQLVLTFIFAIKKVIWAPIITAISILGSIIFNAVVRSRFFPPQQQLSFRGATNGDHTDVVWMQNLDAHPKDEDTYILSPTAIHKIRMELTLKRAV